MGVGELQFLAKHEAAARRTVLWVTQGTEIIGGQHSLWDKKDLLVEKKAVIAVPAQRVLGV